MLFQLDIIKKEKKLIDIPDLQLLLSGMIKQLKLKPMPEFQILLLVVMTIVLSVMERKNVKFVDQTYYQKKKSVSKNAQQDFGKIRAKKDVIHVKKIVLNVQTEQIVTNVNLEKYYIKEIAFHPAHPVGNQAITFVENPDLLTIVI